MKGSAENVMFTCVIFNAVLSLLINKFGSFKMVRNCLNIFVSQFNQFYF